MSFDLRHPIPTSLANHPHKDILLKAIQESLNEVAGDQAVRRSLHIEQGRLWVGDQSYPLSSEGKLYLLAVGKAAVAMAAGAKESLGDQISAGIIVTKFRPSEEQSNFPVLLGDHPVPKQQSLAAARAVESFLKSIRAQDTLLCLISGGASALLTSPRPNLRLREVQKTTQLLLRCGATIQELNTIRKHLDRFKGGGIIQAVKPAQVISLIISDVIGDSLEVIGSGLTAPDPTTFQDALAILDHYELRSSIPGAVLEYLEEGARGIHPETLKPQSEDFSRVANHIIASNRHACEAAQRAFQAAGVKTLHLTSFLQGEASQVGRVFAAFARQLSIQQVNADQPICWIAGGETTVTVRGSGIGGRNSELALGAVTEMAGLENALLITLASDGDDGFSPAAGAVVSGSTFSRAAQMGLQPNEFLKRNDSFSFFNQLNDCIYTTPTHTNVNDLIFLFVS